ncbi:MAG: hypothetical protein IKE15_04095 [Clostridia bacterium]|nr:hypothetical protein [Clostridia bacterium]
MSYFAPYIDDSGLHMPTYEDRLEDLVESYRSIFGVESELSASVPDYQLLSVFAKALDDVSALCLQAYNSRNPQYAAGAALDLLLPQYGITRAAGETDAEVRARIRTSLAGRGTSGTDALLAAVKNARGVKDARVYVNDTDSADADGIPAHSVAVVTRGGNGAAVAEAIWNKKAPGIGTWGSTSKSITDAAGNEHTVSFTPYTDKMIQIYPYITLLAGGDQQAITDAVAPAITDYVDRLGLGISLNVPQLYGVAYAADPGIANTFVVTDMQVSVPGTSGVVRTVVPCAWDEKITAVRNGGVSIRFS